MIISERLLIISITNYGKWMFPSIPNKLNYGNLKNTFFRFLTDYNYERLGSYPYILIKPIISKILNCSEKKLFSDFSEHSSVDFKLNY